MENIHATCVDINGSGILIVGNSASGKSDLALRLIENKNAVLVADDRTDLIVQGQNLIASCPESIKGLIEVRGIGIIRKPFREKTPVKLTISACSTGKTERYPSSSFFENQIAHISQFLGIINHSDFSHSYSKST